MSKKIIIIGAGIAGIAACKRLNETGFNATILEARDRIGGRILTDNTIGIPLGRGASWIHGTEGNPISELAKNTGAKMVAVDPNMFVTLDRNGKPFKKSDVEKFNEEFHSILNKAKDYAFSQNNDISLSSALSKFIDNDNLSASQSDLLQAKIIAFESYIGASNKVLSARHWDDDEAWPGENCFLTSTYQPILEHLARDCSVAMKTIVKKISMRNNDIEIITDNAAYYADVVIVTVPLGVLKKNDIVFDPPLPDYKQKAIQHLEMGTFNITALKFPTAFWPNENHAMIFSQFDSSSISVFFNLHHFIPEPILVGFSGGERAHQIENYTDEQLIKKTMMNFQEVFGDRIPDPESFINTRWSQDPFSYGSYSHIPVGASGHDYDELAKPISNRLFFAGEATFSKSPATTHGAFLSGIREAERIIALSAN